MQALINKAINQAYKNRLDYRERTVVDSECQGLRFVADSKGGGTWVRRHKNRLGMMRQYKFGDYPQMQLKDARAYVQRMRGVDKPEIIPGQVTIGELCRRYLDEYVKTARTRQSERNARSVLERYLEPIWDARIETIKANHLHEIIINIRQHAPTMALALRAELKQAWNYGLAAGWFDVPCPVSNMTGGRIRRKTRDRVLVDGEIRQLFDTLTQYTPTLQKVIILTLYTGMRSGEIIRLTMNDIEIIDGVMWATLPASMSKNRMAHRVPLFDQARTIMDDFITAGAAQLFADKRGHAIRQENLSREVYRKSGVNPWRLHDLRRTTRTNLQRIGCPYEASEAILGHKLPGVSGVYARHRFDAEKIEWLDKLSQFYKGVIHAC